MRYAIFIVSAVVLLAVIAMLAIAQPSGYVWRTNGSDDTAYLFKDGRQVGVWDVRKQTYRELLANDQWGPPLDAAPFPPPPAMVRAEPWRANGVDELKLAKQPQHTVNGGVISYQEGLCPKAEAALTDDSGKLWLSVWAKDPAKRAAVVADLKANPAVWQWVTERCHLWAGEAASPDHFLAKDRDGKPLYDIDGEPTIMLQDAAGVELWHDAGYAQGPPSLEQMRKRDPMYKPDLTPGPNSKKKDDADDSTTTMAVVGAAATGAYLLLRRKGKQ